MAPYAARTGRPRRRGALRLPRTSRAPYAAPQAPHRARPVRRAPPAQTRPVPRAPSPVPRRTVRSAPRAHPGGPVARVRQPGDTSRRTLPIR
ncbi:hypothetical protein C0Q98_07210 [Streptomyces albidoflavus]|nr:hypothetical protein C0Q98_07210 [Streptomyces albidoflavus]